MGLLILVVLYILIPHLFIQSTNNFNFSKNILQYAKHICIIVIFIDIRKRGKQINCEPSIYSSLHFISYPHVGKLNSK